MNKDGIRKLAELRADFEAVTGQPFRHFYCPILFQDADVELCRAHIINEAFRDSDRRWTIQRKDVDGFYGSVFESDFLAIQDRGKHRPIDLLTNRDLSRRIKPQITVNGELVEHYFAVGQVPPEHSEVVLETPARTVRLGLKLAPSDTLSALTYKWEVHAQKDVRLAALSSILKAAHLTMFELMGYHYALSGSGYFLGKTVLGEFFVANFGNSRTEAIGNAHKHFVQFVNMVRPIGSAPEILSGTLSDRYLLFAMNGNRPWAPIVIVRTGSSRHAVLLPNFDDVERAVQFERFLQNPPREIQVRLGRWSQDQGHWEIAPDSNTFVWPAANFV